MHFPGVDKKKTLDEVLTLTRQVALRYWGIALFPAVACVIVGIVFILLLPNFYTATSMLFIQEQTVDSKLIERPDKEAMRERLEALVQELLARPRLRNIVERFNLYSDLRGPLGMDQAITTLRQQIELAPVVSPTGKQLIQTFRLSFTDGDPTRAFEVTRAVANLFIEESMVGRRSEIQSTQEFLEGQLVEARQKLEQTENQVQEFVRKNFGQLPEHLDASIARLESAQQQMATNAQLISSNTTRRANLQNELNEQMRSVPASEGGREAPTQAQGELAQLQSALVVLLSRYSEQHPDVVQTRQRIQALKAQGSPARTGGRGISSQRMESVRSLKRTINDLDVQLTSLREQNDHLTELIDKLQLNIEAMPLKEQELLKIKRDYANVKANYERLLMAKEEAELKSSLVKSQKDTQFRIVEPAELPPAPSGPNRPLLSFASLGAGAVMFLLMLGLCFILSPTFKSRDDIEDEFGLPVIGVIPPMPSTSSGVAVKRGMIFSAVGSGVAAILAIAMLVMFA